jgi:hypothetical protein
LRVVTFAASLFLLVTILQPDRAVAQDEILIRNQQICTRVEVSLVSSGRRFECPQIIEAMTARHRDYRGEFKSLLVFRDDQDRRYVLYYLPVHNRPVWKFAEIDMTQVARLKQIDAQLRGGGRRSRLSRTDYRNLDKERRGIRSSQWGQTFNLEYGISQDQILNLIDRPPAKPLSLIYDEYKALQDKHDAKYAGVRATYERNKKTERQAELERQAAERANAPPNRYPNHHFGEVTTALADGNVMLFRERNDLGWRAQYYHHFAIAYAKKCITNPAQKRSWTTEYFEEKKDRFGNITSRRSYGSQTYKVEASQYAIAKKMMGDLFGFANLQASDIKDFVSKTSCTSREMQNAKRILYDHAAKRASRMR